MIHYCESCGVFWRFRYSIKSELSVYIMRPEWCAVREYPLSIPAPCVNAFFRDTDREQGWRNMVNYLNHFTDEFARHFAELSLDEQAAALTPNGFASFREVAAITMAGLTIEQYLMQ